MKECGQSINLNNTSLKPMNILMVEDNRLDALLTSEILSESEKNLYRIKEVKDGIEAIAHLRRCSNSGSALPDLILLDLNLPRMNGFDFLKEITKTEDLKTIPVFILTTSSDEEDVEKVQEFVDSYLLKPLDLEEFETAVSRIKKLRPD